MDGGAWSDWTSATSKDFNGLSDGVHTFEVKAKNEAGDEDPSPASCTFTVSLPPSSATLAIGDVTGSPGGNACVDLTLSNNGTSVITSLTTDITYDASELTPTGVTTSLSGKLAAGNVVSAGTYRVLVYGGTGVMPDGPVATVCFDVASDAQPGSSQLCHASGSPTASDGNANAVPMTGTCGSVAIGRIAGDCNGDGTVSITELQQVVNNQLGVSDTGCGDCDGNGTVSITELQKVVNCQIGAKTCDTQCVD